MLLMSKGTKNTFPIFMGVENMSLLCSSWKGSKDLLGWLWHESELKTQQLKKSYKMSIKYIHIVANMITNWEHMIFKENIKIL